jgi:branched-chain amino acid transport system permease protein
MDYIIHLSILCGIYLLLSQGFNISFGLGKLFNLAHVAAYAIGAYTTAILATDYGFGFLSTASLSILNAAIFSLIIGGISLRLSDDYFAIGTLAFSFVISALLINWKSLTRGVLGIPGIPRNDFLGFSMTDNTHFMIILWLFVLVALILAYLIHHSAFGRKLKMQSEHIHATMALGTSLFTIRNYAFVISSGYAGIAGCFFSYYLTYIDPSSFALHEMVFILTILIVGQPGSFWGVIGATIFLVLLPEPLRFVELSPGILGPMRQFIYAGILYLTVLFRKKSLFPVKRHI